MVAVYWYNRGFQSDSPRENKQMKAVTPPYVSGSITMHRGDVPEIHAPTMSTVDVSHFRRFTKCVTGLVKAMIRKALIPMNNSNGVSSPYSLVIHFGSVAL